MDYHRDLRWLESCGVLADIHRKCSKAAYFALVIDKYGRVRGTGYNGTPSGMQNCTEGGCPRSVNNVPSSTPYDFGEGLCFSCHAEENAILGIDRSVLSESVLYVNGTPCVNCAKRLAGAGIKRVVGIDESRPHIDIVRDILTKCHIDLSLYIP